MKEEKIGGGVMPPKKEEEMKEEKIGGGVMPPKKEEEKKEEKKEEVAKPAISSQPIQLSSGRTGTKAMDFNDTAVGGVVGVTDTQKMMAASSSTIVEEKFVDELSQLRGRVVQLSEKIGQLNKELADCQAGHKAVLADADAQAKSLLEELSKEKAEMAEKISTLEGRLESTNSQATKWHGEYCKLVTISGDKLEMQKLQQELSDLKWMLGEYKKQADSLLGERAGWRTTCEDLEKERDAFQEKIDDILARGFWARMKNKKKEV